MRDRAYIVLIPLNLQLLRSLSLSYNRIQGDTTYFHISARLFGYVTFPRSSVLSRSPPSLPPSLHAAPFALFMCKQRAGRTTNTG